MITAVREHRHGRPNHHDAFKYSCGLIVAGKRSLTLPELWLFACICTRSCEVAHYTVAHNKLFIIKYYTNHYFTASF